MQVMWHRQIDGIHVCFYEHFGVFGIDLRDAMTLGKAFDALGIQIATSGEPHLRYEFADQRGIARNIAATDDAKIEFIHSQIPSLGLVAKSLAQMDASSSSWCDQAPHNKPCLCHNDMSTLLARLFLHVLQ